MTTKTIINSTTSTYYYSGSGVTLVNAGVQAAPGDSGVNYGIFISGNNDTLLNQGIVYGQRVGVYITGSGDSVVNDAGKSIIATLPDRAGVNFYDFTGTVTNYGLISGYANALNGAGGNAIELEHGGVVTNIGTLSNGGVFIGRASGTVINSGVILGDNAYGGIYLAAGGQVNNLSGGTISANGAIIGYHGAPAYGVWVGSGSATITNAGVINGGKEYAVRLATGVTNLVIVDPGAAFIGTVSGGTAIDATLELASGSGIGTISNFGTQFTNFGTVSFDHAASWLFETTTAAAAPVFNGFVASDTIDIAGFTATSITTLSGNTGVVLSDGSTNETLSFGASISNFSYRTGSFGTELTTTVCFCVNTLIDTPTGQMPVQTLQAGDLVLTAHNGPRKIVWIGTGKVLATRGRRGAATPVIVRKGALADNVPQQDLHVTKGHSLYIDDVLIPVEFLVNHKTIIWDDRAQEVEIYHVELESHDVLIANGAPAESYRDDGNRWLFRNANAGWGPVPQEPYAPVLTGGPVVDAAWRRLLDRAGPRDLPPLTDDPDLHLLVDGVRVDAHERRGLAHAFRLPSSPKSVVIASREAAPAELGIARDPRSLGVALRQVTVWQGALVVPLDADDDRLTAGFHGYEESDRIRWTDGHAELPITAFAGFGAGAVVTLHLGAATRYPDHGERVAA
jgi:hypothetical protein